MVNHFVHTLSELGIPMLLGHKLSTDSGITRAPGLATIVGAIHSSRRHRDEHSPRIVGIEDNRVQAKSSATWLPLGLMLMIQQSLVGLPAFSTIARLEEGGGLDTTIKDVGFRRSPGRDLPDLRERATRVGREPNGLRTRRAPGNAIITARSEGWTPM